MFIRRKYFTYSNGKERVVYVENKKIARAKYRIHLFVFRALTKMHLLLLKIYCYFTLYLCRIDPLDFKSRGFDSMGDYYCDRLDGGF